jgi:hypothetical protein
VAGFQRDGYLVVRRLFSISEMADITRWTDEVQRWPETPGRHMMYFELGRRQPHTQPDGECPALSRWLPAFATSARLQGACGNCSEKPPWFSRTR